MLISISKEEYYNTLISIVELEVEYTSIMNMNKDIYTVVQGKDVLCKEKVWKGYKYFVDKTLLEEIRNGKVDT